MTPYRIGIKTSQQDTDWTTLDADWARIGEHDVFESGLAERPSQQHPRTRVGGRQLRGGHDACRARPPGSRQDARDRRAVDDVPSPVRARQAADRARPRDRRPADRWSRRRLARARAHARSASRSRRCRSASTSSIRRSRSSGRSSRTRRGRLPGVTRPDPYFPLENATNEPGTLSPAGPTIWLGGQKRRGIDLAARYAQGWIIPFLLPDGRTDRVPYFAERRSMLLERMAEIGRDPDRLRVRDPDPDRVRRPTPGPRPSISPTASSRSARTT